MKMNLKVNHLIFHTASQGKMTRGAQSSARMPNTSHKDKEQRYRSDRPDKNK